MRDACLPEGPKNSPEFPIDGGRLGEPELAMSAFEAHQRIRSKKLPAPACQPSTSRDTTALALLEAAAAPDLVPSSMSPSSWSVSMKSRPSRCPIPPTSGGGDVHNASLLVGLSNSPVPPADGEQLSEPKLAMSTAEAGPRGRARESLVAAMMRSITSKSKSNAVDPR